MVIAVNTRLLLKNRLEGIGWFTYETLKRITVNHPEHQFIFIFDRPYDPQFVFSDNVTPLVVSPPTRHPVLWYLWFEHRIPGILKRVKADLFISPDGYLSTKTDIPQLTVIHDLNFVHRPKDLPKLTSLYYNWFFPKFARIASRVATVSVYSKNDIVNSFGIPPGKVDVVYDGHNTAYEPLPESEQMIVRNTYSGGNPYFLFIGALHPRKNVEGLLRAFEEFRSNVKTQEKLLIVGGEMFKTGPIYDYYREMRFRDDVVFTGRIPVEKLRKILGSALALTFVPFFEGFGIPVVEAMAAGVPVICSFTTSLSEAVLYADPEQPSQIAWAMQKISSNETLRKTLIEKGTRQKDKFSWERSAGLLWESIERAISNSKQEVVKGSGSDSGLSEG
jgi:glycosyltransferase involved in cell wall biosynthesis